MANDQLDDGFRPNMLLPLNWDIRDVLPLSAVERFFDLRQRKEDAYAVLQPSSEQEQEHWTIMHRHQARLRELREHRANDGYGLSSDAPEVKLEQKKLDAVVADIDRLKKRRKLLTNNFQEIAGLYANLDAWVRGGIPGGTTIRMHQRSETASLMKKGEAILDAIGRRQFRLRELDADLRRVRSAQVPRLVVKQRAREFIGRLSDQGRPDIGGMIEHGRSVIDWPLTVTRVQVMNSEPEAVGFCEEMPNTMAIFAWLHKDALIAALDREIDEAADDTHAMDDVPRAQAEAQIAADRLSVEREEAALIAMAQAQGSAVEYRRDADPRAVLGVELIATPAPTGEGMAGALRDAPKRIAA